METEAIAKALSELGERVNASIQKYEGQLSENGKASTEARDEVRTLSTEFKAMRDRLAEVEKRGASLPDAGGVGTWGEQLIQSAEFKRLSDGVSKERVQTRVVSPARHNNTVISNADTVLPQQRQTVIPGDLYPKTVRPLIPVLPVSSNSLETIREEAWTNNAAGQNEALNSTDGVPSKKAESAITFEPYVVNVRTIAHFLKMSKQLMADAPAVAAYVDTRLRDGLADQVERQLIQGTGSATTIIGLESASASTVTPTNQSLVDSANLAIWTLWNIGFQADVILVNPLDWSAVERLREGTNSGMYLYGMPGSSAAPALFRTAVVPSRWITQGEIIVAALRQSCFLLDRQAATVEAGYENDDFTRNLVTLRAEERLALAVDRPRGVAFGEFAT